MMTGSIAMKTGETKKMMDGIAILDSLDKHNPFHHSHPKGFTLMEMIIVLFLVGLLFGMASVSLSNFLGNQSLSTSGEQLVQTLREAHARAVAQSQGSSWGVYLDNRSGGEQFVLFKGTDYASRDPAFDQAVFLSREVVFGPFSLNGGGQQIIFDRHTGFSEQDGSVFLQSPAFSLEIKVNGLGITDYGTPQAQQ